LSFRILLSILFIFLLCGSSIAQSDTYQLGILPAVNVNVKTTKGYRINAKLESRNTLYQMSSFDSEYELTDVSLVVSKRVGLNNALGLGYLMRIDNGRLVHRLIQQFNFVSSGDGVKLGHRFLLDQTLTDVDPDIWRLRYRLSGLFPLTGQSIDSKEFYLKLQNEYLNVFKEDYSFEIRANIFMGYKFSDASKLELGMDNRFRNLNVARVNVQSWFRASWYIVI